MTFLLNHPLLATALCITTVVAGAAVLLELDIKLGEKYR